MRKRDAARRKLKEADRQWRAAVLANWNGRCAYCGSAVRPNCHHLFPRSIKQFRHDPKNAIVLCPLHHMFSRDISPHKNAAEFFFWLRLKQPAVWLWLEANATQGHYARKNKS